MTYYLDNKESQSKKQKEYKSTPEFKELRKKYDKQNHQHQLELKTQWKLNNPERLNQQRRKDNKIFYAKNKTNPIFLEKKHKSGSKYYQNNREKKLAYSKIHSKLPHVKARKNELSTKRRKENPHSNRSGSIEIQIAMNNVRKRDHNTCQWAGCGLTFRQSPIHVHHIFPRSEYPDFAEIEQYMICYCANHHGLWHRMRGDSYSEMILARYQENGIISNEVIY